MRYMKDAGYGRARVELTRRNLETLLAKLDDAMSVRTLAKQEDVEQGDAWIEVVAVEDEAHYSDRAPGEVKL